MQRRFKKLLPFQTSSTIGDWGALHHCQFPFILSPVVMDDVGAAVIGLELEVFIIFTVPTIEDFLHPKYPFAYDKRARPFAGLVA